MRYESAKYRTSNGECKVMLVKVGENVGGVSSGTRGEDGERARMRREGAGREGMWEERKRDLSCLWQREGEE